MAFLRRIGGTIERFGRLARGAFGSVLRKHIQELPLLAGNGCSREELLNEIVGELTSWLYSPNSGDPGQASILYVGSSVPEVCYRRDFLTAGLVDRVVQQVSSTACDAEYSGCEHPGITAEALKFCFHEQVTMVVQQLRLENIHNYLELPEGARVQSVQIVAQPAVLPSSLLRAA